MAFLLPLEAEEIDSYAFKGYFLNGRLTNNSRVKYVPTNQSLIYYELAATFVGLAFLLPLEAEEIDSYAFKGYFLNGRLTNNSRVKYVPTNQSN